MQHKINSNVAEMLHFRAPLKAGIWIQTTKAHALPAGPLETAVKKIDYFFVHIIQFGANIKMLIVNILMLKINILVLTMYIYCYINVTYCVGRFNREIRWAINAR